MGGNTQKGVQAQAVKVESRVPHTCPATLDSHKRKPLGTRMNSVRPTITSNFSAMTPQASEADISRKIA